MISQRFVKDNKNTTVDADVALRMPVLTTLPAAERAGALAYNSDIIKFFSKSQNAWLPLAVGSGSSTPAITGIDNIGTAAGSLNVFKQFDPLQPTEKVAQLRRIAPGANISLAYTSDSIVITGAAAAGSTLSDGGTAVGHQSLVQNGVAPNLATKGLVAGNDIFVSSTATDVSVALLGSLATTLYIGVGVLLPVGNFSVSIGPTSNAFGTRSVALGYGSIAAFPDTTALGFNAFANAAAGATAVGRGAQATGVNSLALGFNSFASGADSIATSQAIANNTDAISIGNFANSNGIGSTAVGAGSAANFDSATAIGRSAHAAEVNSTALGFNAQVGLGATDGIAIGQSIATGVNTITIGNFATATVINAIAIGTTAATSGDSNIAIGNGATCSAFNTIAIGTASSATVGDAGTAIGRSATVTGSQALGVGFNCQVSGSQSIGVGWQCVIPGTTSSGFGHNINISASNACCFGNGLVNTTNSSVVIGTFGSNMLRLDPVGLGNVTQAASGNPVTVNAGWGKILVRNVLANAVETFVFNNSRITVNSMVFLTVGTGDAAGAVVASYSGLVAGQITVHIRNLSTNPFSDFPLNYWVAFNTSD